MGITGSFQGMVDSPFYLLKRGTGQGDAPDIAGGVYNHPLEVMHWGTYVDECWGQKAGWHLRAETQGTGGGAMLVRLSDSIELTSYSRLQLTVTSTSPPNGPPASQRFGLSQSGSIAGDSFTSAIDVAFNINQGVYTLDISALVGGYWFYFYQGLRSTGPKGDSKSNVFIYELSLWA